MYRIDTQKNSHGFSLLEVILSVAIFTVSVIGIGLFIIDIMRTAERAQYLNQAVLIADEGIQAVRSIRDNDFTTIMGADGDVHGIELVDDEWQLSVSNSDVTDLRPYGNVFTRSLIFTEVGGGTTTSSVMLVESQVSWPQSGGTATTSLHTYITNWNR